MSEKVEPLSAEQVKLREEDLEHFWSWVTERQYRLLLATIADRDIKLAGMTLERDQLNGFIGDPASHFEHLWKSIGEQPDEALTGDAIDLKNRLRNIVGIDALESALAASEAAREKAEKSLNLLKKAAQEEPHFVKLEHGSNCQLRTIGAIDGRLEKKCTCWKDEFDKAEAARLVAEEQRDGFEYHLKAATHNCDVEIAKVKELYDRLASVELALAEARKAMRKAQQYVDHKPDSSPYEVCRDWCPACAIEKGLAALPAPSPLELAIREWAGMRTAWLKTGKPELAERQAAADALYALIPDTWKLSVISTEPAR